MKRTFLFFLISFSTIFFASAQPELSIGINAVNESPRWHANPVANAGYRFTVGNFNVTPHVAASMSEPYQANINGGLGVRVDAGSPRFRLYASGNVTTPFANMNRNYDWRRNVANIEGGAQYNLNKAPLALFAGLTGTAPTNAPLSYRTGVVAGVRWSPKRRTSVSVPAQSKTQLPPVIPAPATTYNYESFRNKLLTDTAFVRPIIDAIEQIAKASAVNEAKSLERRTDSSDVFLAKRIDEVRWLYEQQKSVMPAAYHVPFEWAKSSVDSLEINALRGWLQELKRMHGDRVKSLDVLGSATVQTTNKERNAQLAMQRAKVVATVCREFGFAVEERSTSRSTTTAAVIYVNPVAVNERRE